MAESDEGLIELPLDGAGTLLRRAREAAGLQLSDIAARTRIAERHLVSLETGNFAAMASRAYAVGFARSYARALGLDEHAIAQSVRDDLDGQEPSSDRYQPAAFEPGDPARVPSGRIAWIAIPDVIRAVMDLHDGGTGETLDEVLHADGDARRHAAAAVERLTGEGR